MKSTAKYKARQADVYDALCERLVGGVYPAGARLPEASLAQEFGVSRTPIREVFRLLIADGLLRLEPNRGVVVEGFTADDVEELYDIRRGLEALAVECAAPSIPLAVLQEFERQIRTLVQSMDADAHAELDQRLHNSLHEHARRRRLSALLQQQYRLMQHFRHMGFRNPAQIHKAAQEHLAILDALLRRDVPGAVAAMDNHLRNSKRVILELITRTGGATA